LDVMYRLSAVITLPEATIELISLKDQRIAANSTQEIEVGREHNDDDIDQEIRIEGNLTLSASKGTLVGEFDENSDGNDEKSQSTRIGIFLKNL